MAIRITVNNKYVPRIFEISVVEMAGNDHVLVIDALEGNLYILLGTNGISCWKVYFCHEDLEMGRWLLKDFVECPDLSMNGWCKNS